MISLVPINSGSYPVNPALLLAPVVCPPHSCTVSAASLPSTGRLVFFTSCPSAQDLWGSLPLPRSVAQTPEPLFACLSLCAPATLASILIPLAACDGSARLLWTRDLPGCARLCAPPPLKPFPIFLSCHISLSGPKCSHVQIISDTQACSIVSDSATPGTVACQAPLSLGFPRQEYGTGFPFPSPGDLPDPGFKPTSPALVGGFFTTEPSRELHVQIQPLANTCRAQAKRAPPLLTVFSPCLVSLGH